MLSTRATLGSRAIARVKSYRRSMFSGATTSPGVRTATRIGSICPCPNSLRRMS
jgi:hypothetical protein